MPKVAIVDIDGTLVDSNFHHAVAWFRAFLEHDIVVPTWRIHRHVGMGGDQLVSVLVGDRIESDIGDAIRDSEKKIYMDMIDEVRPLEGAADFLRDLGKEGHHVVLASSAKEDEVDHYLDLLGVRDDVHAWTTSADVAATKPHPDLIQAALAKSDFEEAVVVGDSTWDCVAAARAGVPTIGVVTGGFSEAELRDAGAIAVFESVRELSKRVAQTPLG